MVGGLEHDVQGHTKRAQSVQSREKKAKEEGLLAVSSHVMGAGRQCGFTPL